MADERIRVKPTDIEKLIEWLRQQGHPQTIAALTREFIRIVHEEANGRGR
jgi:Holliday junction resolvase